jgi:hypothetical protein
MDNQKNDGKYEQEVNKESRNVEDNESPDPNEKHKYCQPQKHESHVQSSRKQFGW